MLSVDFYSAMACYILAFLLIFMVAWVFGKKQREQHLYLDPKRIWYCSVCTYTYINTKDDMISVCPRCQSFNKK